MKKILDKIFERCIAQISPMVSLRVDDFTGAGHLSYPIVVPPGRSGLAPNISLTYSSGQGSGWVGLGWNLDMGAIQRSTKWGLTYDPSGPYVAIINGSYSELVSRTDWGTGYFGSKIEGASSKYYHDYIPTPPTDNGWVVSTKDGTKYYYASSKQKIGLKQEVVQIGKTVFNVVDRFWRNL